MAAGAVAALLAPLGLAAPALWAMELSAQWILFVSHWVASLDGAVTPIVQPGPWVIPLITLAGIWLIVWRSRLRFAAVFPMVFAFGLWAMAERPQVLISSDGSLVGLMGTEGRALSVPRGAGFVATNWLQQDGDLTPQSEAALRIGFEGPDSARDFTVAGWRFRALRGKTAAAGLARACAEADVVILPSSVDPIDPAPTDCLLIGRQILDRSGALALHVTSTEISLIPARDAARLWLSARPILADRVLQRPERRLAAQ